ncbi:MAG: hypothetical protein FWC68_06535 [Oscillospiraceae bacterium]|nr:hypothetical protein [Oscillospiraceae bacterium]
MDLLGQHQEEEKNKRNMGKKIILVSIIVSILLLGGLIYLIVVLIQAQAAVVNHAFYVDGTSIRIDEYLLLIEDDDIYVSLRDLINEIEGYTFYYGLYGSLVRSPNAGHTITSNEVIGFEGESNIIYKTLPNTVIDFANFEITANIRNENDRLYINISDIEKALNMQVFYERERNNVTISIFTMEFLEEHFNERLAERGWNLTLATEHNNLKAISHGMLVVNRNGSYGVINANFSTRYEILVEFIFNKIVFDEYTGGFFFTTSNNRMGKLDSNGDIKIHPLYSNVRIINHSPLLYEARDNNLYGILREDGSVLSNLIYSQIGGRGNPAQNRNPILIIPNVQQGADGIVAVRERNFGIINLTTGRELVNFEETNINDIYIDNVTGETRVSVQVERNNESRPLQEFLDFVNNR